MSNIKSEYRLTEYFLPALNIVFVLLTINPTQWKTNILAYGVGMFYLPYSVKSKYGTVPTDWIQAVVFSMSWFVLSNFLLKSRLKSLYEKILKCEKLITEMKKILHILPHGVIITDSQKAAAGEENCFTNREFDTHIWNIRNKLEELQNVEITLSDKKVSDELKKNKSTLHSLLQEQQKKIRESEGMVETDIEIETNNMEDSKSEEDKDDATDTETIKQTFHVKSLKVEWEGSSSFMHVFIETTNIVKLEEAKNNIKCQKIMFASASHEFRTPLNAIMNSYQFIASTLDIVLHEYQNVKLPPKNKLVVDKNCEKIQKFIKMSKNSSILLLALIEDILDLSKMEAGIFSINNTLFLVSDLIEEIHDIFIIQCQQKKILLKFDIPQDLENEHIYSDESRIKQILLNLMSNAVKFTFSGSISISMAIETRRGMKVLVTKVTDTGLGIKEKDKPKLFSMFGMISQAKSVNPNGSGIGLTICQKYVDRLGGEITLESEYNEGTVVTFWVPIKSQHDNPIDEKASTEHSKLEFIFNPLRSTTPSKVISISFKFRHINSANKRLIQIYEKIV